MDALVRAQARNRAHLSGNQAVEEEGGGESGENFPGIFHSEGHDEAGGSGGREPGILATNHTRMVGLFPCMCVYAREFGKVKYGGGKAVSVEPECEDKQQACG